MGRPAKKTSRWAKLQKRYKDKFGTTIPKFVGRPGSKEETEHYEAHRKKLVDARRHPAYDAHSQDARIVVTVRKAVRYRSKNRLFRTWHKIEDLPATKYIHGMHLPASGNLSDDHIRQIRERVVAEFEHEIELDSDEIEASAEDITPDDVSVHVLPTPVGGTDPGRRPMRDIRGVLMYDEDATLELLLHDDNYRRAYASAGSSASTQCVPVYLHHHMTKGKNGKRHPRWTMGDTKRMLLTGMEDFGVIDSADDGAHDSCVIIARDYGGDWTRLAAIKDVEGYNGYDIKRFCVNMGINLILLTIDMVDTAPFIAHRAKPGINDNGTIVGIVTNNHLVVASDEFKLSASNRAFKNNSSIKSRQNGEKKTKKKKEGDDREETFVTVVDDYADAAIDAFVASVEEHGRWPTRSSVRCDESGSLKTWRFKAARTTYIVGEVMETARVGWTALYVDEPYRGQTMAQLVRREMEDHVRGRLSATVFRALTARNAKDGAVRGLSTEFRRNRELLTEIRDRRQAAVDDGRFAPVAGGDVDSAM